MKERAMTGAISTYLPEKCYGFIKGDDGKDYFFHEQDFDDKQQISGLCEAAFVVFDQQATPKGYKARRCRLIDAAKVMTYVKPDGVLTSRSNSIRGWDMVECGGWVVHGTSSDSPDAARKEVIKHAILLEANAVVELEYYKTTGSEQGTGRGTHYYTIHNFRGRPAVVAKRNARGQYRKEDLLGVNERAQKMKDKFEEEANRSANWSLIVSVVLAAIIYFAWDESTQTVVICVIIGCISIALLDSSDDGKWLEKAGES